MYTPLSMHFISKPRSDFDLYLFLICYISIYISMYAYTYRLTEFVSFVRLWTCIWTLFRLYDKCTKSIIFNNNNLLWLNWRSNVGQDESNPFISSHSVVVLLDYLLSRTKDNSIPRWILLICILLYTCIDIPVSKTAWPN